MRRKGTRRRILAAGMAAMCVAASGGATAQSVTYTTPLESAFHALMPSPQVAEGMIRIGGGSQRAFEEQKRLGAMPLAARMQYLAEAARQAGLEGVRADAGRVLAHAGTGPGPRLLVSARMDGGEDVRGLVCILAVMRALQAGAVRTSGDIVFALLAQTPGQADAAALLRDAGGADAWIAVENGAAMPEAPARPDPAATGLAGATARAAQIIGIKAPVPPPADSSAGGAASLGVPALAMASGGAITRLIPPAQEYKPAQEWKAPQSLFLIVLALSGVEKLSEPLLARRVP